MAVKFTAFDGAIGSSTHLAGALLGGALGAWSRVLPDLLRALMDGRGHDGRLPMLRTPAEDPYGHIAAAEAEGRPSTSGPHRSCASSGSRRRWGSRCTASGAWRWLGRSARLPAAQQSKLGCLAGTETFWAEKYPAAEARAASLFARTPDHSQRTRARCRRWMGTTSRRTRSPAAGTPPACCWCSSCSSSCARGGGGCRTHVRAGGYGRGIGRRRSGTPNTLPNIGQNPGRRRGWYRGAARTRRLSDATAAALEHGYRPPTHLTVPQVPLRKSSRRPDTVGPPDVPPTRRSAPSARGPGGVWGGRGGRGGGAGGEGGAGGGGDGLGGGGGEAVLQYRPTSCVWLQLCTPQPAKLQAAREVCTAGSHTTSSCGVCGKSSIDAVRTSCKIALPPEQLIIESAVLLQLPQRLLVK